MSARRNAFRCAVHGLLLPIVFVIWSCDSSPTSETMEPIGFSKAYNKWVPSRMDTCSPEVHNQFTAVGPDGKVYPTWHPPSDPQTGCTFGHEHGRDPRGSDLYDDLSPLLFAYANEQLDVWDPLGQRHEDHFGHKVEWENNVRMSFDGGAGAVLEVTCDIFTKFHQGTHSKDAFTNNLHELIYAIRCSDQTEMRITVLTPVGTPGEMVASCDDRHITVGAPTPLNSPEGNGERIIPDRHCVERHLLVGPGERSNYHEALHESWQTHTIVRRAGGQHLASFDPYFQVFFPSRFYDPSLPGVTGRPIEVCYEVTPAGGRVRGGECEQSTANGALSGLTFDDPRSRFNGVERVVDINGNRVTNSDGPEIWYTDPFGRNGQTQPFPGSIRQFISRVDNSGRVSHGPTIGRDRNYGGPGVHAPN